MKSTIVSKNIVFFFNFVVYYESMMIEIKSILNYAFALLFTYNFH